MLFKRNTFIKRLIIALLALLLISALPMAGLSEEAMAQHNYILVIDNSRSTTGRHSLGEATDPMGLRFDAARLVYQNVLSSGKDGQLGVIVFCGPKNCVSYGPMDVHDPNLDAEIGDNLNAEANKNRRDAYTDIRTALQTALSMLEGFEGQTSVILLSDGVNDLSNKSDPFNRPENIEANDQSVALVEAIHEAGADFHVIALTTRADVTADDPFMAFINRLAAAGGGEPAGDGSYDNVLVATQADVESKLLQMLIQAESASQVIQTIVGYTPVEESFTVPYTGITDVTVNITFMPEDKARLQKVALASPGGQTWTLWEGGAAQEADGAAAPGEAPEGVGGPCPPHGVDGVPPAPGPLPGDGAARPPARRGRAAAPPAPAVGPPPGRGCRHRGCLGYSGCTSYPSHPARNCLPRWNSRANCSARSTLSCRSGFK